MKNSCGNGTADDKTQHENRDSKGRFTKGAKPGPGRGKRKTEIDPLAQAEAIVIKALKSPDVKDRLKAASLLPKFQALKPEDSPSMIGPEVMKIIDDASEICAYKTMFSDLVEMAKKKPITLDELQSVLSSHEDPFHSFDDES